MNKLITLSEYVELQEKIIPAEENGPINDWNRIFMRRIISYTRFLRQPLTVGIFVPVDNEGNVLVEPKLLSAAIEDIQDFQNKLVAYETAKERVLFEGFELHSLNSAFNADMGLTIDLDTYQFMIEDSLGVGGGDIWGKTLEALAYTDLQLPLTPSALKIIGKE